MMGIDITSVLTLVIAMGVFISCLYSETRKDEIMMDKNGAINSKTFIERMIELDKKAGLIRQIPITDSNGEYVKVISFLKEKGYEILHNLNNINDDAYIVSIIVDNQEKVVSKTNVTCMAAWCSFSRYPLNVKEFITNYERFVLRNDIDAYFEMIYNKMKKKK